MKKKSKRTLTPRLRFQEFQEGAEWKAKPLAEMCDRIVEKVGDTLLTPVSITAGKGFVSQVEKFSRDISGAHYKNYIWIRQGDFAYNKGNSKSYPQGCVRRLKEFDQAAAPSAFISFRLHDCYVPEFFEGLFEKNAHGRQLIKFITSSARSDGLLNISPDEFFSVKLPIPREPTEQQKIAECLSSLDGLIAAEGRTLEALKDHKKGLMQQLFPQPGQTQPRLRFPEFRGKGKWISESLGKIFETSSGGTPERSMKKYWNGQIPWISTSLVDFNVIYKADEFISEVGLQNSSAKIFPRGTVLVAMYGQGKTRGKVALLGIEATTNQACAAIIPREDIYPYFVFLNLAGRYDEMRNLSNSGGQENLSQGLIKGLQFSYPNDINEQRTIADCLTALDTHIAAQAAKIESLKTHKHGLMQQLFPAPEEQ